MRNLLRELRALRAEVEALRAEVAELRARPPVVITYPAAPAPVVQPWAPYVPNPYTWLPTVVSKTNPVTVGSGNSPVFIPWNDDGYSPHFTGSPLHVAAGLT